MNIASAKVGDIVRVDKKGRIFHAEITDRRGRELVIRPLQRNISYNTATSREVKDLWRKSRQQSRSKATTTITEESS